MFNLYDRDNDGCLSREEFEELYARDDVEEKEDDGDRIPTESDAVLDRFDTSMNGKLELSEFQEFWPIFCEICPF